MDDQASFVFDDLETFELVRQAADAAPVTSSEMIARVGSEGSLSPTRRRNMQSALRTMDDQESFVFDDLKTFELVDQAPYAPPATIRDMIARVEAAPSLLPTRRRDLQSALRTLLRITGAVDTMPATVETLRSLLRQTEASPAGLSDRRRQTLRSDITVVARLYGMIPTRPSPSALSAGWLAVKNGVPDIWLWRRVSQLAYWATANGLEPAMIDQSAIDRFALYLKNESLEQKHERKLRGVVAAWKALRGDGDSQKLPALSLPSRRNRVSLTWEELPAPFVADLDAYRRIAGTGGLLLDDSAPAKPLRMATINGNCEGFRRAASLLLAGGFPREKLVGIRTLVEPEPFRLWVEAYHNRLGRNAPSLFNLIASLTAWAARQEAVPKAQIAVMRRVMKRIERQRQGGMTEKNRGRIRQFTGGLIRAEWLAYGDRLVRDAKGLSPKRRALRIQTALVHELLLVAPLRLTNLAGLRVGVHLHWQTGGRQPRLFLVIPGSAVKNGAHLEYELPERVARLYRRYVESERPLLLADGDGSDWLLPGRTFGSHKTKMALQDQITTRVRRDLGLAVNLHLYRHLAAWFYLQAKPGDYETIRRLLGHKNIQTTITSYIEIDQIMVSQAYNKVMEDLRWGVRR